MVICVSVSASITRCMSEKPRKAMSAPHGSKATKAHRAANWTVVGREPAKREKRSSQLIDWAGALLLQEMLSMHRAGSTKTLTQEAIPHVPAWFDLFVHVQGALLSLQHCAWVQVHKRGQVEHVQRPYLLVSNQSTR